MKRILAWQMVEKNAPFEQILLPEVNLKDGDALVEIAGCGVCHTDLGFWRFDIPTRHKLPLVLGHEISGTVIEGPFNWVGQPVIVPAVIPCGVCDLCKGGRSNICQSQKMPGNDFHGGFASHIVVPARILTMVTEEALSNHTLPELAVVADAVSTPYQVMVKSGIQKNDFAIIIGVGGVGVYGAQLARIFGGNVLALDVSQDRLDQLAQVGIKQTINISSLDPRDIKKLVREKCREMGAPSNRWKIYEMSGTKAGQELGFSLLGIAGTLSIVGFTMDKLEIRLSNLMAFDAKVVGTWGCKPELYADVIRLIGDGKLKIRPFTETFSMSKINEIFQQTLNHRLTKRSVLIPDFT